MPKMLTEVTAIHLNFLRNFFVLHKCNVKCFIEWNLVK